MTKDRVGSFIDAVLAIIITLLVLNLKTPAEVTLKGFLDIHESLIAYSVSFFWIGTIWAAQIIGWSRFYSIDRKTILWVLAMLFATSLFPYFTNIVADHLYDTTAEVLYGILAISITLLNVAISRSINRCNHRKVFGYLYVFPDWMVRTDMVLKGGGLILAFVWAPAMMLALTINIVVRLVYLAVRKETLGIDHSENEADSCDGPNCPVPQKPAQPETNTLLSGHTDL